VGEVVEGGVVGVGCGAESGGGGWVGVGEAGAQEVVVGVSEEQGVLHSGVGDLVAAGVGDAGDQSVSAQAPQVVGPVPGGDVLGGDTEEGRDEGAQLTVGEPVGEQPVDEQGLEQGVHAGSPKRSPGNGGALGGEDRCGELGEGLGTADRVVADGLDAQQAPVGGEADLRLGGIVSGRRDGRHQIYTVDNPHVLALIEQVFEHIGPDGQLAPDPPLTRH
jgi:hypothetical protein